MDLREKRFQRSKNAVEEFCACLHLDNDNLAASTSRLQQNIWKDQAAAPYTEKGRLQLCISLWETLNRQNCPRPLNYLCVLFNVTLKSVKKEIVKSQMHITPTIPSDYVSTLCQCLHISFGTEQLIYMYVKKIEKHPALISKETCLLLASSILFIIQKVQQLERRCQYENSNPHFEAETVYNQLNIVIQTDRQRLQRLLQILPNVTVQTLEEAGVKPRHVKCARYCLRW